MRIQPATPSDHNGHGPPSVLPCSLRIWSRRSDVPKHRIGIAFLDEYPCIMLIGFPPFGLTIGTILAAMHWAFVWFNAQPFQTANDLFFRRNPAQTVSDLLSSKRRINWQPV